LRDRLQHYAFQRTLAQLTEQQADEKLLFLRGGAGEKICEQPFALGDRAGAAGLRDRFSAPSIRSSERAMTWE
jgi:hypothetical protein